MPNITVQLLQGRTLQQRRDFASRATDVAIEVLGARRDDVRIVFEEIGGDAVANGGVLAIEDPTRAAVVEKHASSATKIANPYGDD